jgi:serine/threonine protein kinase
MKSGMGETTVATIIKYVLRAVIYLHDQKLIHGNINPNNILLHTSGEVRLTGLTKPLPLYNSNGENIPNTYAFVGQPAYMAPEVIGQNRPFDKKADIYSLGITALEMLLGVNPFNEWPPLKVKIINKYNLDHVL